jgi:hypothetical protein
VSDADVTTAPFFTLYCEGRAVEDGILDAVEAWHESSDDEQRSLPEFLGMTDEEYSILGMDGRSLPLLAEARRTGRDLRAAVAEHVAAMRANPTYEDGAALYALTHWVGRNPVR